MKKIKISEEQFKNLTENKPTIKNKKIRVTEAQFKTLSENNKKPNYSWNDTIKKLYHKDENAEATPNQKFLEDAAKTEKVINSIQNLRQIPVAEKMIESLEQMWSKADFDTTTTIQKLKDKVNNLNNSRLG